MPDLDVGKYKVKVIDAYLTDNPKNGNPGVCWTFSCESGRIDCTRFVSENNVEWIKKDMVTLGFPESLLEDVASLERLKEFSMGKECEIVVEEGYQGKPQVKWINSLDRAGSGRRAPSAGIKDRLAALLAGRPVPLVSQPRQQEPFAPTPNDDDVPY